MKRIVVAIAALLVVTGSLCAAEAMTHQAKQPTLDFPQMPSRTVGTELEAKAAQRAMTELHARLVAEQVKLGTDNGIWVQLSADEMDFLYSDVEQQRKLKVGVDTPVGIEIAFAGLDAASLSKNASVHRYGAARRVADGAVWTMAVNAAGASGVRLHLTGLDLPEGAELALYNKAGEAFRYTGKGPLGTGEVWTHTVVGDEAILQLKAADLAGISFTIDSVGYMGDNFDYGARWSLAKSFCDYNASCVFNANCGDSNAVNAARDGVGHMLYMSRGGYYICSGGLINNDAGKPYFLTANHCISKDRDASSLEAYFFYEIACNQDCGPYDRPSTPRTLGSSVVATNRTGDYTLLELSQPAPAGTVLIGWDSTPVHNNDGLMLYRISHPGGAPQAYSEHSVDASTGTCTSWPRGSWIYEYDEYGATEGGSSGSPVVNGAGKIVGQLSGACGTNLNDTCDAANNATVDGAFASYYGEVAGFLGGGSSCDPVPEVCGDGIDNDCDGFIDEGCSTCTDADNDGVCLEDGDCKDDNAFVYPGAEELCDGIDNDCDGTVDEGCGSCLGSNETCSTGADCCSGWCHPSKNYCR